MNDSNYNILAAELSGFLLPLKYVIQLNLNERNIKCKDPFYQQVFEYWFSVSTSLFDNTVQARHVEFVGVGGTF